MLEFDRLKDIIKEHEGFRGTPYRDTEGKLTIGYGRNLDAKPLTREEADYLVTNDIVEALTAARRNFPWFNSLDPARQAVVVSMIFNMGLGNLKKGFMSFKKMIRALQFRDYDEAARQMLDSKWANQVKSRAKELEAMMRSGEWPA